MKGDWHSSPYAKTISGLTGIDVDGLYGFQCKDWSNGYAAFLGDPFTAGNAIALWQVDQPGWTKVSDPKPGDVFVKNAIIGGVNYGHTGTVESLDAANGGFWSWDQNYYNSSLDKGSPPARVFHRFSEMLGYLRNNNLGGDMNKDQASQLALYMRLAANDTLDKANANNAGDVAHILADPGYAPAMAKQIYQGNEVVRWKASHFDEEITKRDQTISDLTKKLADAGQPVVDPDSIVITKSGWAAAFDAIKSFFSKNK
jgi:hypothetical protein